MKLSVDLSLEDKLREKLGPIVPLLHRGEIRFNCPFCHEHGFQSDSDWHLYVGYRKGRGWICHRCGTAGKAVDSLLTRLGITRTQHAGHWHQRMKEYLDQVKNGQEDPKVVVDRVPLPDKFLRLIPDLQHLPDLPHFEYLHDRGLDDTAIRDWQIGVARDDRYAGRVILPDPFFEFSSEGELTTEYWVARTLLPGAKPPYLNPESSARTRVFNLQRERSFTVIVEGVFDVYGTGPHAIALYGKNCSSVQLERILEFGVPPFYVALDEDAIIYKGRRRGKRNLRPGAALALAESLYLAGKVVYLVILPKGKDPGDLGSKRMYELCETAIPYDPTIRMRLMNEAARSWV